MEPAAAGKTDDEQPVDIDDYFLPADDELDSYFQARSSGRVQAATQTMAQETDAGHMPEMLAWLPWPML